MAGYQILEDNTKKDTILRMEGICPCCSHYPSKYIQLNDKANQVQFLYICPKCESKWKGNLYDKHLNLID